MAHASRWPHLAAAFARFGQPAAIVDLESTGGDFCRDRITEVAVLRFENGCTKRYEWLVNPQQPISSFITKLTGIDDDMVKDAPVFAQIAPDLLPLLRGALVVAHNSRFDYNFLRHEFQRTETDFAAPALCTVQLSRRLYPQFHKHNLDSIIERFGIQAENRHRAMTDVLALADFLERSLAERGEEEWSNQCRSLMNPKKLPSWLPDNLAKQLYTLPDRGGIAVWLDENGRALAVVQHQRAYTETAAQLHSKHISPYVRHTAAVRFTAAVGAIHAVYLKAQAMQQYGIRPSETARTFVAVEFVPDERGVLQARIVPMHNGFRAARPYGFFLHKKAAKRALAEWAQTHNLCPDLLNILPSTHAKNVPCPVQAVGQCSGKCKQNEGIVEHNRRIAELAHLLPVADWDKAHEIEITETDPVSGQTFAFTCAGNALALPDGCWYFDDTLPATVKAKFKQGKTALRVIA